MCHSLLRLGKQETVASEKRNANIGKLKLALVIHENVTSIKSLFNS